MSYPLAALGALLVGLLESFSSFWASAFKEVIVFTLIIPVLLWRSLRARHVEEEEMRPCRGSSRSSSRCSGWRRWCCPSSRSRCSNYIGLYALVALGLVLLTGVGGLTSFGQAAFVGLGAYTTAVLTTHALPASFAWLGSRRGSRWSPAC